MFSNNKAGLFSLPARYVMVAASRSGSTSALMRLSSPMASTLASHSSRSLALRLRAGTVTDSFAASRFSAVPTLTLMSMAKILPCRRCCPPPWPTLLIIGAGAKRRVLAAGSRRRCLQRRHRGHRPQPRAEAAAPFGQIAKAAGPRKFQRCGKNEVRHARRRLQQCLPHLGFKHIRQPSGTGCLMRKQGWRSLVLRSAHFTYPNRNAVAEAARRRLEPAIRPVRIIRRSMEAGLAVEAVEIRANDLAVLKANSGIINEVGHPAGRINLIIGTVDGARLGLDDFDAFTQPLFDNQNARQPRIGRTRCDVKLHRFWAPTVPPLYDGATLLIIAADEKRRNRARAGRVDPAPWPAMRIYAIAPSSSPAPRRASAARWRTASPAPAPGWR